MALSETLYRALQQQDLDTVEATWLELLSEQPPPIDDLLRIAELLDEDNSGLAKTLLELLDDQLQQEGRWDQRLQLIRGAGKRYLKPGTIHQAVLDSLRQLYEGREDDIGLLMSELGLDRGKDETPKLWDKVERLRNLLIYEVGTVVAMSGKGVGRVVEVNLKLQTLKVDFDKHQGVAVGFRAAGKMLELLDEDHVLRRKLEEPQTLADVEPSELLRITLESYSRPLSGAEIRANVDGIVAAKSWSSWWAAARKHPQVVTSGSSRRLYAWAETSDHAEEALWEEFEDSDIGTQIDLLRRAGNQDPALRVSMTERLRARLETCEQESPVQALEIWAALERQPGGASWDPGPLIARLESPSARLAEIGQRALRERAYKLVREHREDWREVLEASFPLETDPRTLELLMELIGDHDPAAAESLVDQAIHQWQRAPAAFTFAAERAADDEGLRARHALRLLKQILAAHGDGSFADQRSRLESLLESGGTVPRLLSQLAEEEAAQAEDALERSASLQDYQRQPLINALHLRFPELQQQQGQRLYATAAALESKREELRQLLDEEIPANRRAIEEARAMGDLRENFEYKAARQRHEYLSARASGLSGDLERAQVIDLATIDSGEVRIGSCVVLRNDDDERRITILGPWESAPERDVISYESELAQQLLGKKVGDRVALSGEELSIASIEAIEPSD